MQEELHEFERIDLGLVPPTGLTQFITFICLMRSCKKVLILLNEWIAGLRGKLRHSTPTSHPYKSEATLEELLRQRYIRLKTLEKKEGVVPDIEGRHGPSDLVDIEKGGTLSSSLRSLKSKCIIESRAKEIIHKSH
ncbi:hypothetical protein Tco_1456157 [Tanacetum coccineum]